MSLKPQIIPQNQVVEQVQNMSQQKQQLENSLALLQNKLKQIEHSISENDQLKFRVRELMDVSLGHFQLEWTRRIEYYPEIRLHSIEKAIALLAPKK